MAPLVLCKCHVHNTTFHSFSISWIFTPNGWVHTTLCACTLVLHACTQLWMHVHSLACMFRAQPYAHNLVCIHATLHACAQPCMHAQSLAHMHVQSLAHECAQPGMRSQPYQGSHSACKYAKACKFENFNLRHAKACKTTHKHAKACKNLFLTLYNFYSDAFPNHDG